MPSEPTPADPPEPGRAPQRRAERLLAGLAARAGVSLSASTVFGEPVERGGVTVVPVASARVALGGGGGADPAHGQEGEGGGVMGGLTPIGHIELSEHGSRFVPVVHPARMLALACGAALAGLLIARRAGGARAPHE